MGLAMQRLLERRSINASSACYGYIIVLYTLSLSCQCDFISMQYGSGKTMGAEASNPPTYVYPLALKSVVRARHSQAPKEWEDPVGDKVTNITPYARKVV